MKVAKKYQNISFYTINFFLTGALFALPLILVPSVPLSLFLLAPAISAVIMVALVDVGIGRFFREIFLPKVQFRWIIIAAVLPTSIVTLTEIVGLALQDGTFVFASGASSVTALMLIQLVIGATTEEIGWRGFMLPRMARRYGNLKASLLLGLIWGLWHVGDFGEGLGFVFFVGSTIGMSIIMTWIREKSGGGVLMAAIFHIFYNLAGVYICSLFYETGGISLITRAVAAAACLIPAVALVSFSPVFKKKAKDEGIDK
jgi:membrane protease YdiL (CAAX protease family)